jgi:hypothetical protein
MFISVEEVAFAFELDFPPFPIWNVQPRRPTFTPSYWRAQTTSEAWKKSCENVERLIKFVRGARQISGFAFALAQPPLYLFKYFEIEFRNKNNLKELLYQFSATCNFN